MHKLAARATSLSRAIFASLPWGYRVAHLFEKLAIDTQEAFGRFAYAEFLKAGVEGLPEINGKPALDFRSKVQGPRGADKLPRGYGKKFGSKVWRIALSKLRSPEVVEDAIAKVMMKLVQNKMKVQEGAPLATAESFIITSVINAGKDIIKRKRFEKPTLTQQEDGEYKQLDITDPSAFQKLNDLIPRTEMRRIMQELKRVHDKAPEWVEAQLEGLTNTELAAQWGTSIPYITKWTQRYVPDIKKVFYKHLKDVG